MPSTPEANLPVPSPEKAAEYVRKGINEVGGWPEAFGGLCHSTLPALFGFRERFGLGSVVVLVSRVLLLLLTALFPLFVRKSFSPDQGPPAQSMTEGVQQVWSMATNPSYIDLILGLVAIGILATPKIADLFKRVNPAEVHSPFYDLTAALRRIQVSPAIPPNEIDEAIKLALMALREEMSILIGDSTSKKVTDVSLLEFCDADGKMMQVRVRTANHEGVRRPVESGRLVAYYVAREGRNFAEQDFKNSKNPFPPKRVSVRGAPTISYRSVLYIPIIYTEVVHGKKDGQHGEPAVIDRCGGVICIHNSKPFRFWRWGDHKKGVGGFADVAFGRAMPYIAVVERLLSTTAHKVKLEVR